MLVSNLKDKSGITFCICGSVRSDVAYEKEAIKIATYLTTLFMLTDQKDQGKTTIHNIFIWRQQKPQPIEVI